MLCNSGDNTKDCLQIDILHVSVSQFSAILSIENVFHQTYNKILEFDFHFKLITI